MGEEIEMAHEHPHSPATIGGAESGGVGTPRALPAARGARPAGAGIEPEPEPEPEVDVEPDVEPDASREVCGGWDLVQRDWGLRQHERVGSSGRGRRRSSWLEAVCARVRRVARLVLRVARLVLRSAELADVRSAHDH